MSHEYKIVSHSAHTHKHDEVVTDLIGRVNGLIAEGWEPLGGLVATTVALPTGPEVRLYQAMVRHARPTIKELEEILDRNPAAKVDPIPVPLGLKVADEKDEKKPAETRGPDADKKPAPKK
ncbi:MAG TPA: hypothetical protein VGQ80_18985 [Acidimicrobiia bacterium]|nr:hypothetical protein [Acidimicrobiia bacterium]